ncbi:MAG: hypothetical protein ABL952_02595 [Pyrinomonadaceae bacterium]
MTETPEDQPAFDPLIQTENIAFRSDEMVECEACSRKNAPNRLKCMYCGGGLAVKAEFADQISPISRKLEAWEKGFNVVFRSANSDADAQKAATLLQTELPTIEAILSAGTVMPLARVESLAEADLLISRLFDLGFTCSVVTDESLNADDLPVRISGIDISDGIISVIDFNTQELTAIPGDEMALIVTGVLSKSKVDMLEKKGRHGKSTLLDETEATSDEAVIDIYSRSYAKGFRINLAGFDFSCLGEEKGLLASENIRRLAVMLKANAPNARFINDYVSIRHTLGDIWEIEARRDPKGRQRAGFGRTGFGSISSTSNVRQFTKYSRLQWQLLKDEA